ncbi:aspartyl/asparaginyl beta-hydroxylase domain-containing protein [Nitrospira sp. Kam-Ns4a]
MNYHGPKAWLNHYFARYVGGDRRPVFYDIPTVCPALEEVTRHYPVIREECERLLAAGPALPRYHDIDPGERAISAQVDPDKRWSVFMLYLLGWKPPATRAHCPETCRIPDRVPTLIQAFFSVLDPGKNVPLHKGLYLGYLRYHLGLLVPKDDPPRMYVNGQEYVWKAGEAVLWDDTWPHEVKNSCRERRVVLIVDVLRPLPWLPSLVNRVATFGIAGPFYGRAVARRAERMAAGNFPGLG